jgi:hypothetical protein
LRYHPDSPSLWQTRAAILDASNQPEAARAAYLMVMQVTEGPPGQAVLAGPRAHIRAYAAYRLALQDNAARHFTEGERYARMALSLNPDGAGYHATLGGSLRGEGRIDEAQSENATELRLRLAQQKRGAGAHP